MNKNFTDRWEAFADNARQVGESTDAAELDATLAALFQTAGTMSADNIQTLINTDHVPKDAGVYTDTLADLLDHIPDGWGRWISCGRGWYGIVAATHIALKAINPDYEVEQVKEKFGGLRYYYSLNLPQTQIPGYPEPVYRTGMTDTEDAAYEEACERWCEALAQYEATDEGKKILLERERRETLAEEIVKAAEAAAAITCEQCGQPGELRTDRHWIRTLCDQHATG